MYIKLVGVYISDIHLQVLYIPTSFLSNLIGQNVQAMVQDVVPTVDYCRVRLLYIYNLQRG